MHRLHFIEIVQTRKHLLFNLLRLYAVCSEMRNQNNMKMPMSERHIPCEQSRSLLCNEQNKRPFLSSHAVLLLVGLAVKSNNSYCCYDELKRCIFNYKKNFSVPFYLTFLNFIKIVDFTFITNIYHNFTLK